MMNRCALKHNIAVCVAMTLLFFVCALARAQSPIIPAGLGTEANPYKITQIGHLVWIHSQTLASNEPTRGKFYTLMNDIDALETMFWPAPGFFPIGPDPIKSFKGDFNGNQKVIRNLSVRYHNYQDINGDRYPTYVGLFGSIADSGSVYNLTVADSSVESINYVNTTWTGGIAGHNSGTIAGCKFSGTVEATAKSGWAATGGLAGRNSNGKIMSSTTTGTLLSLSQEGYNCAGGLVGWFGADNKNVTEAPDAIINCSSNMNIRSVCYGTRLWMKEGDLTDDAYAGGLVGLARFGAQINGSYATGNTSAHTKGDCATAGSFAAIISDSCTISDCHSLGNAVATGVGLVYVGGFVGINAQRSTISRCYSVGNASSDAEFAIDGIWVGGFIANTELQAGAAVNSCYWDTQQSGNTTSDGGVGRITSDMCRPSTYVGWEQSVYWGQNEYETPHLRSFRRPQGSILVVISAPLGAKWQIPSVTPPWLDSGTLYNSVPLGKHLVEFSAVVGHTTPSPKPIFANSISTYHLIMSYGYRASVDWSDAAAY